MQTTTYIMFFLLTFFAANSHAEIYKYKDKNGKWQYTDKKPKDVEPDVVNYKSQEKEKAGLIFAVVESNGLNKLQVTNPFFAPVELLVKSPQFKNGRKRIVIAARAKLGILKTAENIAEYNYWWYLGDPKAKPGQQLYHWPVDSRSCPRITQGFNGKFSHTKESSQYAVDIALSVGTPIVAARKGVVVRVKDDYHMGGVNDFFLDKGNYVSILHEDGTFALYAHILLGTAAVKPGDKVDVGTMLAKSGSSGFSSGPHLHFVVYKNKGFAQASIPFQFIGQSGNSFTPEAGTRLCSG